LAKIALRLGKARIQSGDVGTAQVPAAKRKEIANDLEKTIARFQELWLARNRQGGLSDSIGRLQNLLETLRK
jgi:hypothetical protein